MSGSLLNMNLVGDAALLARLLSPWDTHCPPRSPSRRPWVVLRCWGPIADGR